MTRRPDTITEPQRGQR